MKSELFIHIPSFPLSQFVKNIWLVKGPIFTEKTKVLPDGTVQLCFNLSQPYTFFDQEGSEKINSVNRGAIIGLQNNYMITQTERETDLVIIGFQPGGAYAFFGFPMSELTDQIIESELIKRELVERTLEQLHETSNHIEKIKVVEAMLLQSLSCQNNPVQSLTNYLGYSPLPVNQLIEKSGYTHAHTISLFKKYVGTSPKKFYRLRRFRNILRMAEEHKELNWKGICYHLGYHDHAHFTHDFKEVSGLTPKQYSSKKTFVPVWLQED